jgi:hypothetical protein
VAYPIESTITLHKRKLRGSLGNMDLVPCEAGDNGAPTTMMAKRIARTFDICSVLILFLRVRGGVKASALNPVLESGRRVEAVRLRHPSTSFLPAQWHLSTVTRPIENRANVLDSTLLDK